MRVLITPSMCRSARAALGWSAEDLAEHAGVARRTVVRLEQGKDNTIKSSRAIIAALTAAGVSCEVAEDGQRERVTYDSRRQDTA
jgi:transcriptional regulator with XRE-family HTH domain